MDHRTLARDFLALFCAGQGIATVLIDLNRTHATNPEWARHARFHLVWQVLTTLLLSAIEVALVVRGGLYADERFYLAFTLTCIPLLAFLAALLGRRWYGGALYDPNGILPLRLTLFGNVLRIDLNVAAVAMGLVALATILRIYTI